MSKVIEVDYQGKFKSTTKTHFNSEPPVTVNASRFTPVDLLASAYASCLMATIDFAVQKAEFQSGISNSEVTYEMAEDGKSVGSYTIKLFFSHSHTEEQKQTILSAAKNLCHVGNTINPDIPRNIELIYDK